MYSNELYHHGIKGMKWGVRRFQNEDGSLTSAGERRYGSGEQHGSISDRLKGGLSSLKKKRIEKKERNARVREVQKARNDLTEKYNSKHKLTEEIEKNKKEKEAYREFAEDSDHFWDDDPDVKSYYKSMADEHQGREKALREIRDREVKAKVEKQLLKKYGQERLDEVRKSENFEAGAALAATAIGIIGMSVISYNEMKRAGGH